MVASDDMTYCEVGLAEGLKPELKVLFARRFACLGDNGFHSFPIAQERIAYG